MTLSCPQRAADFLDAVRKLFDQRVVRGDGDDRHVAVDQRQRVVLQFAGRESFGVRMSPLMLQPDCRRSG